MRTICVEFVKQLLRVQHVKGEVGERDSRLRLRGSVREKAREIEGCGAHLSKKMRGFVLVQGATAVFIVPETRSI
jgi:hypothetical protein